MSGWLKLKLTLKERFCDVSVTAFVANFFMHSPERYLNEHIQSLSVPNALSETKICKRRALASLLCGSPLREANHHQFHLIFRKVKITVSWEYWLYFTQFRLRWMTGFMVRSNGVMLTFVYFYQLRETAWTSTLYFHTFTENARFEINVETLLFACANFINCLWYKCNCLWYKCSVGLRTVPKSVKTKADYSRLEETVSKRKKSSYWNFIYKGLQICSKMGSWWVERE